MILDTGSWFTILPLTTELRAFLIIALSLPAPLQYIVSMVIASLTVTPVGTKGPGLSRYVAECVRVIEESGIRHTLTPMGSVLEGTLDEILELVRTVHRIPFHHGVMRVSTRLVIDERRDKDATAQGKVEAVKAKLEKES